MRQWQLAQQSGGPNGEGDKYEDLRSILGVKHFELKSQRGRCQGDVHISVGFLLRKGTQERH